MPKEYYLYVNGQRVKVSEQIYKVYWREKEHEKYLEQVDKKTTCSFFSSLDHDGNVCCIHSGTFLLFLDQALRGDSGQKDGLQFRCGPFSFSLLPFCVHDGVP